MAGVKSVRRDAVSTDEIVGFIRRWSRFGRVTTQRISDHFGLSRNGLLNRLKRVDCLTYETLPACGNVWKVKE